MMIGGRSSSVIDVREVRDDRLGTVREEITDGSARRASTSTSKPG